MSVRKQKQKSPQKRYESERNQSSYSTKYTATSLSISSTRSVSKSTYSGTYTENNIYTSSYYTTSYDARNIFYRRTSNILSTSEISYSSGTSALTSTDGCRLSVTFLRTSASSSIHRSSYGAIMALQQHMERPFQKL